MKNHGKDDKIHEALELLNEAAKEKKEEVFGLINEKYDHLREMFADAAKNGQSIAEDVQENISEAFQVDKKKIKQMAAHWDKKVRKNPWAYIGGAALGSLFLVKLFSRKKG